MSVNLLGAETADTCGAGTEKKGLGKDNVDDLNVAGSSVNSKTRSQKDTECDKSTQLWWAIVMLLGLVALLCTSALVTLFVMYLHLDAKLRETESVVWSSKNSTFDTEPENPLQRGVNVLIANLHDLEDRDRIQTAYFNNKIRQLDQNQTDALASTKTYWNEKYVQDPYNATKAIEALKTESNQQLVDFAHKMELLQQNQTEYLDVKLRELRKKAKLQTTYFNQKIKEMDRNQTSALKTAESRWTEQYLQQTLQHNAGCNDDVDLTEQNHAKTLACMVESQNEQSNNLAVKIQELEDGQKQQTTYFSNITKQLNDDGLSETNALKALRAEWEEGSLQLRLTNSDVERRQQEAIIKIRNYTSVLLQSIESRFDIILKEVVHYMYRAAGWKISGNWLYKCFMDDRRDYLSAENKCELYGGRLAAAVIRKPDVMKEIHDSGIVDYGRRSGQSWIGLDDIELEGDWNWSDGGTTNPETTVWDASEPNDLGGEDCAALSWTRDDRLHLNDISCSLKLHYLCEIELIFSTQ